MEPFKNLSVEEKDALLKFPVYLSLQAYNRDGILDEYEKKSTLKFDYNKSFCHPLLSEFYIEVDKDFANKMEQANSELPKGKEKREEAIKQKLLQIENIIFKLGKDYISIMQVSMKSYKEHVFKEYQSVIVNFIFPLPIPE